jgi:hypothetical protein
MVLHSVLPPWLCTEVGLLPHGTPPISSASELGECRSGGCDSPHQGRACGMVVTPRCDPPRSPPWCPTPLLRFGERRYAFAMLQGRTRQGYGRQIIAALLAYVLALHLIGAGLVRAAHAAQKSGLQALLDPHALCLSGPESDSPAGDRPDPGDTHHHDLCCTVVCGVALLTPTAFTAITYAAAPAPVVHPTSDFGARPSTAPPGSGQGPRAPPSFLV